MTDQPTDLTRDAVAAGPDIIVRADERGMILYVSATCAVLGYVPADLVGKSALDLVHPDDRARLIENTASAHGPGDPRGSKTRVHRFRRKDGSWAWLRGHPTGLPRAKGRPGELLNFFEPISPEDAAKALRD